MRVQRDGSNTIASGDLYLHHIPSFWPWPGPIPQPWPIFPVAEPNPSNGIPIFARGRYRYYLSVTQILEGFTIANSFTLGFEMHRFDLATRTWTNEGAFTALMTWTTAPPGYPSTADFLTGEVKNGSGAVVGALTMGWVSAYLRRAVVEIDRVSVSEAPLDNGTGVDWLTIFDQIGWDVDVLESNSNVTEPSGESWSDAELHAGMLAWRDSVNLDQEWRYHVLCVRRLDSTSRGIMYDAYGTDSNNVPREGCGISSHWIIPNTNTWGLVAGLRFGTATGPYFRTALHETGHAAGLYHNTVDLGIMNTTDVIAAGAVPPVQFPNNIQWSFAPDDKKRLRHMPDVWVRPGGIPFGSSYSTAPISPDDLVAEAKGIELRVSPLLESVPIGAPVRISFRLVNTTKEALPIPSSLSMKSGHVRGKVIDPSGSMRTFSPIVRCLEEETLNFLGPGSSATYSVTLLRGGQGALFPSPGAYRVLVDVMWDVAGSPLRVRGETSVMVTQTVDEAHAAAARRILATPDSLVVLVVGGDHLKDGVDAINAGLSHPVLRPHFAFVEAKRLAKRFGKRKADWKAVADLVDETTVMSQAEVKRLAELARDAEKEAPRESVQWVSKMLRRYVDTTSADEDTATLVRSL